MTTLPSTTVNIIRVTKTFLRPEVISFSKVSHLPPSHLLHIEDSDDDDICGVAHSPYKLHVKCQEEDDDYEDEEQYYQPSYIAPPRHYQPYGFLPDSRLDTSHLPPSLIQDLQAMLADYRQRFRPLGEIPEPPPPQPEPPRTLTLPPPDTLRITPRPLIAVPPTEHPSSSE